MQYCSVQYITVKYKYSDNVQPGQMDLNCSPQKKQLPYTGVGKRKRAIYTLSCCARLPILLGKKPGIGW